METITYGGKEYRYVELRGRGKWVSRDGDAINPERKNQKATMHINPDGYPCFGGGIPVHLYVANAWVEGRRDGAEVDHIDFDRTNYHAENLRWVSHRENVRHSSDNTDHYSKSKMAEKNGRATFSRDEVEYIKSLYATGMGTMDVIKTIHPELSFKDRKRMWSKYNRIKTGETWCD